MISFFTISVLWIVSTRKHSQSHLHWPSSALLTLILVLVIAILNPSHSREYQAMERAPQSFGGASDATPANGKLTLIEAYQPRPDVLRALPQTVNWRRTLASSLHILSALMLGSLISRLAGQDRSLIRKSCAIILVHGVILSWGGVYFQQEGTGLMLGEFATPNPRFFGTFRYNNFWAGWIILAIGAGTGLLMHLLHRRHWNLAKLTGLGLFLLAPPLLLAQSRSAILITALFATYGMWRIYKRLAHRNKPRLYRLIRAGLVATCLTCAAVIATAYLLSLSSVRMNDTANQLEDLRAGRMPDMRLALTRDALKLAVLKPAFGWGLGSFEYAHPRVAGPEFTHEKNQQERNNIGRMIRARYAHNDWAQILAEMGLIGTGALVCVIVPFIRRRTTRTRPTSLSRYLAVSCACVLALALWDAPMNNFPIQCLFATCLGLSLAARRQETTKHIENFAKSEKAQS